MRKLWKGVLIGGAVGAGVAAVQASRSETDAAMGPALAKAAGEAALVGGAVGWFLDRRDRKRRRTVPAPLSKVPGALAVADIALPVLQHAAEIAARRASEAADVARPRVQAAAEAARPHVEHAAEVVRSRANEAADAARPHVQAAADSARRKAGEAADAALRAVVERDGSIVVAV
jgi:hypothetical protein